MGLVWDIDMGSSINPSFICQVFAEGGKNEKYTLNYVIMQMICGNMATHSSPCTYVSNLAIPNYTVRSCLMRRLSASVTEQVKLSM